MTASSGRPGCNFGREWRGYRRSEVDAFVDQTIASLEAIGGSSGAAPDPMDRIGGEIASLLRTLAQSVASMHDEAERQAEDVVATARAEATELTQQAEARRAEADRAVAEATARSDLIAQEAGRRAEAIVREAFEAAKERLRALEGQRLQAEHEVRRATAHLADALGCLASVEGLHLGEALAAAGDDVPPSPTVDLSGGEKDFAGALARWAAAG